jgi:O-antigen/teichoic acid export membrane protein
MRILCLDGSEFKFMITSALSRVLQFLMLLLTLRVATSLLAPNEMGKLAVITATVAFFALFLVNPVGMFINRRMFTWNVNGQVRGYLRYFWFYICAVAGIAMSALWFGTTFWQFGILIGPYALLVAASLLFGTLNQTVIPALNLFGDRMGFAVLTVATTVASLAFAWLAAVCLDRRAESWMWGLLLGQLLIGLIGLQFFHKVLHVASEGQNPRPSLDASKLAGLLAFAWPVALSVGLGWVQSQSYRLLVQEHLGLHDLGLFATGFGISAGITAGFESIVATYFQPIFYKKLHSHRESSAEYAWKEYARAVLPPITLTAFLIIALAPQMTQVFLGAAYRESSQYMMWGAIAEWARIATAVFALFAHAKMQTRMLIYPNLLGAVLAVVLVWEFIRIYGAAGIGPALVLSAVGALALSCLVTWRSTGFHIAIKKVTMLAAMAMALMATARLPYWLVGTDTGVVLLIATTVLTGALYVGFQLVFLRLHIWPTAMGRADQPPL